MAMKIDPELCTSCGDCEPECPEAAIRTNKLGVYEIIADRCTECEGHFEMPRCEEVCEVEDCVVPAD